MATRTISHLKEWPFEKLSISFSGGRTSAVMTKFLKDFYGNKCEIVVTFANTGCEHPETLRFVKACDENWGFKTIWLEAEVSQVEGIGVSHRIVNFFTASRDGRPFRDFIAKYGIPNSTTPQCTGKLKTSVMESFLKTQGFIRGKGLNYYTAIGIRSDEADRISSKRKELKFIYPLVQWDITKEYVLSYMRQFSWDLKLPEHWGNCVWCWKKNLRKLLTIAEERPDFFDFPRRMEEEFGSHKADLAAGKDGRRVFFREYQSADEIIERAQTEEYEKFTDKNYEYKDELDQQGSCGDVCDVYSEKEYE